MDRRGFIRIIAAAGAAGAAWKCGSNFQSKPVVVEENRFLMGTLLSIQILGGEMDKARNAARECLTVMSELESVVSRYQPNSQLSHLNQEGKLSAPHPFLKGLIGMSLQLYELSEGRFDISILPVLRLYQQARRRGAGMPGREAVEQALSLVDTTSIKILENEIHLEKTGGEITLDGIAKGAVVEQGAAVLQKLGFENVLVEAGGDLIACGMRENRPWMVGVKSPRGPELLIGCIEVENQAVATSGDYYQTFRDDFSLHHILSPQEGTSPDSMASATVVAGEAAAADGLATALMNMGVDQGLDLVEKLPGVEALLISKNLNRHSSSGLRLL